MQLFSDRGDIEGALAEFISAAFSPEEREIQRLRARMNKMPPRSHSRVILQKEIVAVRLRQLGARLPA